jgi:hypothetical protein
VNQTNSNWDMILLPTDTRSTAGVERIINKYSAIHNITLLQLSGVEDFEEWRAGDFHRNVYKLTDRAISMCPSNTHWFLVTNGDNLYHPAFLNHLNPNYDIIAHDFYSRWVNNNFYKDISLLCYKLTLLKKPTSLLDVMCMQNNLKFGETDLGSNILNWRRWVVEGRKFSKALSKSDGKFFFFF